MRERVLRTEAGQSDLPVAAVRRCCCELCDALRCAVDARNARTMIAILVVAMRAWWRRVEECDFDFDGCPLGTGPLRVFGPSRAI